MESLSALSVFVQAADARNLSEAGRLLGMSPSAIGKSIARLESNLGVRLFHRNTRCITLTAEGGMLLERSRCILREMGDVERELTDRRALARGKLRVTLPVLGPLFAPALCRFIDAYPDIELDLDFTDRLVDIVDEGYDVAIRTGEGVDSSLMSRRLGAFRMVLVASPAYLHRAGIPRTPCELADHICLHRRHPVTGMLEKWPLATGNLALPVIASTTTLGPLREMAESGCGIACLPDFTVAQGLADGRLERLLGGYLNRHTALRAVWPSSRQIAPRLRVFIDHMAREVFPDPSALPAS
ncbi:LysR family transcriptional regulator [Bacillus sp. NP157]|nr:LysR family transcriptional regulator [Bacillus sp. NP157]